MQLPENVAILGDPHLGRKFKTGVPLHRMGDRERMQWADFEHQVMNPGRVRWHVNMGDLFDKFVVAPEIVLRAARIYERAAAAHLDVGFIVIRGNHDVSRDTAKKSSFDLFTMLVAHIPNITVIDEVAEIDGFGFVPYDAFIPVADQVAQLSNGLEAVFMHHDFADWGGDHVIPTAALAEKDISLVIDGHDHLRRTEKRHGVTVEIVGSMQPFTHAEDPDGGLYITCHLEELPDDCSDVNVRVLLREGETLPDDVDCLSLTAKRVTNEDETLEVDTSEFESLSLGQMLADALDGLSIKDQLMEAFENA